MMIVLFCIVSCYRNQLNSGEERARIPAEDIKQNTTNFILIIAKLLKHVLKIIIPCFYRKSQHRLNCEFVKKVIPIE